MSDGQGQKKGQDAQLVGIEAYMAGRWTEQLAYFEKQAAENKRAYLRLRRTSLVCNWLTPICLFVLLLLPDQFRNLASVVPLVLSAVVLGTYQWDELHNYGAKWEKFRIVAEVLKRERSYLEQAAGHYIGLDASARSQLFVETVENVIQGTDITFFSLLVEPGKRIEKRLEGAQH